MLALLEMTEDCLHINIHSVHGVLWSCCLFLSVIYTTDHPNAHAHVHCYDVINCDYASSALLNIISKIRDFSYVDGFMTLV